MELKPPDKNSPHDTTNDDDDVNQLPPIETCFQLTDYQLKARSAMLQEVVGLERDFQDLFGVFKQVQVLVHEQAEPVQRVAENVECTQIAVEQGTAHLRAALKYQKAAYPLLGAVIGTCVAGPFGLIVGMKAGVLGALGGGVLGYTGGKVLNKESAAAIPQEPEPETATQALEWCDKSSLKILFIQFKFNNKVIYYNFCGLWILHTQSLKFLI